MKGALIADSPIPQDLRRPGFFLESGDRLPELTLRYEVYGRPSASPPLLVFHALTGSAHLGGCYSPEVFAKLSPMEQAFGPRGWWEGMLGPGRPFDPDRAGPHPLRQPPGELLREQRPLLPRCSGPASRRAFSGAHHPRSGPRPA